MPSTPEALSAIAQPRTQGEGCGTECGAFLSLPVGPYGSIGYELDQYGFVGDEDFSWLGAVHAARYLGWDGALPIATVTLDSNQIEPSDRLRNISPFGTLRISKTLT